MARRIIGIVVTLLGAAAIVLGILSATSWRTSDTVTATSPAADVPFVVVEPGVPGTVDDQVEVVVTAADPAAQVTVITGRDVDVDGWLADAAQQRIVDVVDWETMVTQDVEGVTQDLPSPVGNDMWLETREATGELAFSYDVPTTGRETLLIVDDGADGPAPTVSFTWQREVTTPYYQPLLTGGIAGVVVGLALVVWSFVRRPRRRDDAEVEATGPDGADGTEGDTSTGTDTDTDTTVLAPVRAELPVVGDPSDPPTAETAILTRRQLRELRESGAEVAGSPGAYDGLRERLAEVDVERIASEISPAAETAPAPDDPEAYPDWLRAQGADGTDEGRGDGDGDGDGRGTDADADTDVAQGAPVARVTWGERWGVTTPAADPGPEADTEREPEPSEEPADEPAEGTADELAEDPAQHENADPAQDDRPTPDPEEHR